MESSLDLRQSAFETGFEKDDVRGTNKLYNEKPGTVGGKHNDNTAGSDSAPINGQRGIFAASNIIKPERNSSDTMHVWCIDSLYTTSEPAGSTVKNKEDVDVGIGCVGCPNRRRTEELQSQFGELRGVGTLRGYAWESPISQKTRRSYRFVHAYPLPAQEESVRIDNQTTMSQVHVCNGKDASQWSCNDTPISILVEEFKDKSRIANFIGFKVLDTDPKELIYYITYVAEYGFGHIIIVGETEYEMIFLDCYGRVFKLDDMSQFLWPLGALLKKRKNIQVLEIS
jgi:hypothetical protein